MSFGSFCEKKKEWFNENNQQSEKQINHTSNHHWNGKISTSLGIKKKQIVRVTTKTCDLQARWWVGKEEDIQKSVRNDTVHDFFVRPYVSQAMKDSPSWEWVAPFLLALESSGFYFALMVFLIHWNIFIYFVIFEYRVYCCYCYYCVYYFYAATSKMMMIPYCHMCLRTKVQWNSFVLQFSKIIL